MVVKYGRGRLMGSRYDDYHKQKERQQQKQMARSRLLAQGRAKAQAVRQTDEKQLERRLDAGIDRTVKKQAREIQQLQQKLNHVKNQQTDLSQMKGKLAKENRSLSGQVRQLKQQLAQEKTNNEAELAEQLQQQADALYLKQVLLDQAQAEQQKSKAQYRQLQKQVSQQDIQINKREEQRRQLQNLVNKYQSIYGSAAVNPHQFQEKMHQFSKMQASNRKLSARITELEHKLVQQDEVLAKARANSMNLQQQIEEINGTKKKLKKQRQELQDENQRLKKIIDEQDNTKFSLQPWWRKLHDQVIQHLPVRWWNEQAYLQLEPQAFKLADLKTIPGQLRYLQLVMTDENLQEYADLLPLIQQYQKRSHRLATIPKQEVLKVTIKLVDDTYHMFLEGADLGPVPQNSEFDFKDEQVYQVLHFISADRYELVQLLNDRPLNACQLQEQAHKRQRQRLKRDQQRDQDNELEAFLHATLTGKHVVIVTWHQPKNYVALFERYGVKVTVINSKQQKHQVVSAMFSKRYDQHYLFLNGVSHPQYYSVYDRYKAFGMPKDVHLIMDENPRNLVLDAAYTLAGQHNKTPITSGI